VAFSPDGRRLAAPVVGNAVKIWDAATGKEVFTLVGHRGEVLDVGFSPDGKWIASAGRDGARLWSAATGKEVFAIQGQTWANRVAFSPDGKRLATAGNPGTRVWDVATGKELANLVGERIWESSAAFRPDGKYLATANVRHTISLWNPATGERLRTLMGHTGAVHTITFRPDGKRLASASVDQTVKIWDPQTGRALLTLRGHTNQVHTVDYSPDGRRLVTASSDRTIRLWDARTGQELLTLNGHTTHVYCAVFSPGGGRLATTSNDGQILLWDLGGPGPRPEVLTPAAVEALWADLAGDHAPRAFRAIFALSAAPRQAVPFLKKRLRPARVPAVDAGRLARLIADLDEPRYATRQRATRTLEQLGKPAEPALVRALATTSSPEVRCRVERLLEKLDRLEPTPEQLLAQRATEVLERIGTPEARAILASLAAGAEGAWLTQEAKASLQRLLSKP
jgi:uncharacterized protein with WD repeat